MIKDNLIDEAKNILKEALDLTYKEIENINENTDLINDLGIDLGLDELDIAELSMFIENKYDILIETEDLLNLHNVKDIMNILDKYIFNI